MTDIDVGAEPAPLARLAFAPPTIGTVVVPTDGPISGLALNG